MSERLVAVYVSSTFPKGCVVLESECQDGTKTHEWEDQTGQRSAISSKFVQARKHAWTRREV